MLARARSEAVGLQQMRGIFFYIDPNTQGVNVALVEQVPEPTAPRPSLAVDVYLDLTNDRDVLSLPKGVGVQVIDDGGSSNNQNDRYLGFNKTNANNLGGSSDPTDVSYGGVILFNSRGHLVAKSYALRVRTPQLTNPNQDEFTAMGRLLYIADPSLLFPKPGQKDVVPIDPNSTSSAVLQKVVRSQLGYVLFEFDAFKGATEGTDPLTDWQMLNPSQASYNSSLEKNIKEKWLDENATAVLINRYTGALVKGE
jgi:hypothetical protein